MSEPLSNRCWWCHTDPEESALRHEGPHATWCPHYRLGQYAMSSEPIYCEVRGHYCRCHDYGKRCDDFDEDAAPQAGSGTAHRARGNATSATSPQPAVAAPSSHMQYANSI
jgi:hypothetical protein